MSKVVEWFQKSKFAMEAPRTALILTFSPREKESPLPLEEGWGEGFYFATTSSEVEIPQCEPEK